MSNSSSVTFDEGQGFDPIPRAHAEPKTLVKRMLALGVAKTPGEAALILVLLAGLLVALNVFLFARAVPEQPTLGADVLRPGEVVPAYTRGAR